VVLALVLERSFRYVVEGSLTHEDSMGNKGEVTRGGLQYMSAGSGVRHSEFNHSPDKPLRFIQCWVTPDKRGVQPR
jgi:redox-sensitive bicupin YhaK (pirin superfamily)